VVNFTYAIILAALTFLGGFLIGRANPARRPDARSSNLPPPKVADAPGMDRVASLAASGEKIMAIKLYRDIHPGVGLKEAKDAVEAMEASIQRR